ncbi:UbiA family prenyltransferase [Haladaptatus sp. DYSN1]|uniref:UbiA family prenyltransferase n=1 Tax=unclassified Haladaptatus TaxID=2622732 RepID=UPI002405F5F1|nr:UbiA family prenyltransferase [Haladaptatus sp. DYSN1]
MHVARHGTGLAAATRALASQIHPVFMLPPIAASWFGAVLAIDLDPTLAGLHMLAAFFALYTAHVKDGYVDFYVRGEDDDHPLSAPGAKLALALSSIGFFACLIIIGLTVDFWAALLTLPGWLIGFLHAPQLDMHPVTATMGYPLGISFALLGGYYVQTQTLTLPVVAFAVVFLVILSGIKIIDDAKDYDYDRSISKRSAVVVLGKERSRRVAYALMALGLGAVLAFSLLGVFPLSATLAVAGFGVVALIARHATPKLATMLLIRGSYVFLALLLVAVWFRPLG